MPGGDEPDIVFGPYRLDRRKRSLTREGVGIPLGGRAVDTLAVLVAASGATVGKQALLDAVWPDLTVEENNLQVQISALRKALGEGWIVTVPGRGYRLAPPPPPAEPPAAPTLPDQPSIAVLPFANLSDDPRQEYFADGMVEEIITGLSRVRSFFVIARNSSFIYKGKSPDVRQVARELGVRYVLEGSVRKAGDRVRIAGQLVDATTGAHLWADRFDGALEDVFDLQDRVTASVVTAIAPSIRSAEIERAQRKPTESLRAYDLVLRAQFYFPRFTSRESEEEAISLLRRAVEIDPTYALALAMLAWFNWALVAQGWIQGTKTTTTEIVRLARTALERGGDDPDVLAFAAIVIGLPGGDLYGGIALADRSLSLNHNSIEALSVGGMLHAYAGNTETAIDYLERAARLNPLEGGWHRNLALSVAHFVAGRHEAVLEFTEKVLRELPNHAPSLRYRAASLGLLGRIDEGRQVVQQLRSIAPDWTISRVRAHLEIDMNKIFKTPGVVDAVCEGLRRAGLPE